MNTNDLIKSLGMVSPSEMPPRLIKEIHEALTERDALQAENITLMVRNKNLELARAEDSIKLLVFNEVVSERDALQDKLDDFYDSYKTVIAERGANDEIHCTCVPFLRIEIDKLRAAIDRNINNAVTIANYTDDMIVIEMAHNIVNDLGDAYGIVEDIR